VAAADFRTRADGVIEYRYQMGASNKRRWESWEPVAIHAVKNIRIPAAYLAGLREEGYTGGPYLIDLLQAEGWLVEREDYLELENGTVLAPGPQVPRLPTGRSQG